MYKLKYKPPAVKAIQTIPKENIEGIIKNILELTKNPLPRGVKKLKTKTLFRIRHGNFRIGYGIDKKNKEVIIYFIKKRDESTYK